MATGPLLSLVIACWNGDCSLRPLCSLPAPSLSSSVLSSTRPTEGPFKNCTPGLVIFLLHNPYLIIQLPHKKEVCTELCARQAAGDKMLDGAQSCPRAYGLGLLSPHRIGVRPPSPLGPIPCPPLQPILLCSLLTNLQDELPVLTDQCWSQTPPRLVLGSLSLPAHLQDALSSCSILLDLLDSCPATMTQPLQGCT